MANATRNREAGPRTVALIGPYLSGKTTLLESMAAAAGALDRKGTMAQGNTLGDSSPEARAHHMSTEVNVARFDYLGEALTVLDCPGSIEFLQETLSVVPGVDAAVLVCEPEPGRVLVERNVEPNDSVTTFVVAPEQDGRAARVRIETELKQRPGIAGKIERFLIERAPPPMYAQELKNLSTRVVA